MSPKLVTDNPKPDSAGSLTVGGMRSASPLFTGYTCAVRRTSHDRMPYRKFKPAATLACTCERADFHWLIAGAELVAKPLSQRLAHTASASFTVWRTSRALECIRRVHPCRVKERPVKKEKCQIAQSAGWRKTRPNVFVVRLFERRWWQDGAR